MQARRPTGGHCAWERGGQAGPADTVKRGGRGVPIARFFNKDDFCRAVGIGVSDDADGRVGCQGDPGALAAVKPDDAPAKRQVAESEATTSPNSSVQLFEIRAVAPQLQAEFLVGRSDSKDILNVGLKAVEGR